MGNNGISAISDLNIENIDRLKKFSLVSNKTINNDQLSVYRKK